MHSMTFVLTLLSFLAPVSLGRVAADSGKPSTTQDGDSTKTDEDCVNEHKGREDFDLAQIAKECLELGADAQECFRREGNGNANPSLSTSELALLCIPNIPQALKDCAPGLVSANSKFKAARAKCEGIYENLSDDKKEKLKDVGQRAFEEIGNGRPAAELAAEFGLPEQILQCSFELNELYRNFVNTFFKCKKLEEYSDAGGLGGRIAVQKYFQLLV